MNKILLTVPQLRSAVAFYTELFNTQGQSLSENSHVFDYGNTQLVCTTDSRETDNDNNAFRQKVYLITTDHLESFHQTATELLCQEVDESLTTGPEGNLSFSLTDPYGNKLRFVKARACAA
ncbi:VOC family protein [Roseivirga sp. BDSF3-8]|uniref:VOC family protein n=1 Tax=Roseivirga sp. BDSF3-8 TaxID=3241598 RepID=UPI0035327219